MPIFSSAPSSCSLLKAFHGFSSLKIEISSSLILIPVSSETMFISIAEIANFSVRLSILKPNLCSNRTALKILVGSSMKLNLWSTLILFAVISLRPPKKSSIVPKSFLFKDKASVFIVKSLLARSCLMLPISTSGSAAGFS